MTDTQVPSVKTDKPPTAEELKAKLAAFNEEIEPTKEEVVESVKEEKVEDKAIEQDYKKRYVESTREAQILHAKEARMNEAIDKANTLPEPTNEEMTAKYADWDLMSELEKRLAKDNQKTLTALSLLSEVTKESKDIQSWHTTVDTFVEDPKSFITYPGLEGKTEEFKEFTSKKSRRGVDMDTLVNAFLWEAEQSRPKHKGAMFPTGGQASSEKPKVSSKLSFDEAKTLRETNYQEYMKKLTSGQIEMQPE